MNKNSKIFIAGHKGLVGSAILRMLSDKGYSNIFYIQKSKLDLTNQTKVFNYLNKINPDAVIIAAAKVGGIYANNIKKAEFIYTNLAIQNNLLHGSYLANVKNLIFLGSSCIYPKFAKQPIKEEYLLSGKLEPTNEPYAIAKIAGLKMCESYNFQYGLNYKCLMPCNLYGPGDNYDLSQSHFFPALLRKIYDAKKNNKKYIEIWGDGTPKREMMYVDDIANAVIYFLKKNTKHTLINVGSGIEMKITDYAKFIINELNYNIQIKFDKSKPNGTPRKLIDSSLANSYGWNANVSLKNGFKNTFIDFVKNYT